VYRLPPDQRAAAFEAVVDEASTTVVCGVGFVDLSGFTSLTQKLPQG